VTDAHTYTHTSLLLPSTYVLTELQGIFLAGLCFSDALQPTGKPSSSSMYTRITMNTQVRYALWWLHTLLHKHARLEQNIAWNCRRSWVVLYVYQVWKCLMRVNKDRETYSTSTWRGIETSYFYKSHKWSLKIDIFIFKWCFLLRVFFHTYARTMYNILSHPRNKFMYSKFSVESYLWRTTNAWLIE